MYGEINKIFLLVFILICIIVPMKTNAECANDVWGKVYCSKYPNGGAAANVMGNVMCGRGQCKQSVTGKVWCSKVEGGGAAVSVSGSVKCVGGCEEGTESMCAEGE